MFNYCRHTGNRCGGRGVNGKDAYVFRASIVAQHLLQRAIREGIADVP